MRPSFELECSRAWVSWPVSVKVLQFLISCFGAYCRPPAFVRVSAKGTFFCSLRLDLYLLQ